MPLRTASLLLALIGLLFVGGPSVLALSVDGEEASVTVEPSSVTAGGSVMVAGSGLALGGDRLIVLASNGLTVELGWVVTDAVGRFQGELTIPAHLPTGSYELRAIGDGTLTTSLTVIAAGRGGPATAGTGSAVAAVVSRRSSLHLLVVSILTAGVIVAAGLAVVRRAERRQRELRR